MKFKEKELIEVRTRVLNGPYWPTKCVVTHKFTKETYKYPCIYEGNDINVINQYIDYYNVYTNPGAQTWLDILCNLSDIPNILKNIHTGGYCSRFTFYNYQNKNILRCDPMGSYPGFTQCQYNSNLYTRNDENELVDIVSTNEVLPKKIKTIKRKVAVVLPEWTIDPNDNTFCIFDANDPDFIKNKTCPDFTPDWLYNWLKQFSSCIEVVESGFKIDDITDIKMLLASDNVVIYKLKDLGW